MIVHLLSIFAKFFLTVWSTSTLNTANICYSTYVGFPHILHVNNLQFLTPHFHFHETWRKQYFFLNDNFAQLTFDFGKILRIGFTKKISQAKSLIGYPPIGGQVR